MNITLQWLLHDRLKLLCCSRLLKMILKWHNNFLFCIYRLALSVSDIFYVFSFSGPSRTSRVTRKAWKEGPKGQCLPTSDNLFIFLFSFSQFFFFPLPFSVRLPKLLYVFTLHLNDVVIVSDVHYNESTQTVQWYGRPLSILIVHSVTSLDYGALFSQTLVCFGSGFDQAVLLRCQGPFVKLESKQL